MDETKDTQAPVALGAEPRPVSVPASAPAAVAPATAAPVPTSEPVVAPVQAPTHTGTLTVGSLLAHGIRVILPSGNYQVGGNAAVHNSAGYGATPGIPAAEFEAWLIEHADDDFVRKGLIIVLSRQPE